VLLFLPIVIFPSNFLIFQVSDQIQDNLFKHFGSRTKNIQILNLTGSNSDNFVLIMKGWIFIGEGVEIKKEYRTILEIQTENTIFTTEILLKKKGMYVKFGPYLLILPRDLKRIRVIDLEISTNDL